MSINTIILNDNETLTNKSFIDKSFGTLIHVRGDNVVIENIIVKNPQVDFHRIIRIDGVNCRIKNCTFEDINVKGCCVVIERKNERIDKCIIENCIFKNGKNQNANGNEAIRLGYSGSSLISEGQNIINNNTFENWNRETEIISVKCNNNIIINNKVFNSEGTITLRHGRNSVVYNNFIDANYNSNCGGIRVIDTGHVIANNILKNFTSEGLLAPISISNGIENSELNGYFIVEKCNIIDNKFLNCNNVYEIGYKIKSSTIMEPCLVEITNNQYNNCNNIFNLLNMQDLIYKNNKKTIIDYNFVLYDVNYDFDTFKNDILKLLFNEDKVVVEEDIIEKNIEQLKTDLMEIKKQEVDLEIEKYILMKQFYS